MQPQITKIAPLLIALLIAGVGDSQAKPKAPKGVTSAPATAPSAEDKAKSALAKGDTKAATKYANQMLKENTDPKAWYYGNVIDEGNQILGLAALREGRVADAKKYLIAAGKTPGSPQLDSFGPRMILAQQLLDKGEKQVVIDYLDLVAKFWAYTSPERLKAMDQTEYGFSAQIIEMNEENQRQIDEWKSQIRAGKKPKLN